jgi:hypothetical protein
MKYVKHVRLHQARRLMLAEGARASEDPVWAPIPWSFRLAN